MIECENNDGPKVSVIMSVHNGEPYIREAINSILGQTLTDWEFLIIDDASTDGTAIILKQCASNDSRIKILTNPINIGLTKSLNLAIRQARAEFLARQDADDISAPGRLEKQLGYMQQHSEVAVLGCLGNVFTTKGIVRTSRDPKFSSEGIKRYLAKRNNMLMHGSIMMRRSCLAKVGFYRGFFLYSQDYDLWLRLSQYFDVAILPENLYQYRISANAASVSHYLTQKLYANIARQLHAERCAMGKDSYDMLVSSYPHGLPIRDDVVNKYDYHTCLAKEFISGDKLKDARRELWKAWELGCRSGRLFRLLFMTFLGAGLLNLCRDLRDLRFRSQRRNEDIWKT